MSKLNKRASTSDLMNIDITYAGKRYRFNLYEELQVSEDTINKSLKTHATSYSFLRMLRSYLLIEYKRLDKERRALKNKLYLQYRDEQTAGRAPTNDTLWARVDQNKKFKEITDQWLQAELNHEILDNAVISYETRKDLMQSLSANVRKER